MDNFYEFLYSCGLMARPLRCWSDHIGPIAITIICAVGFCYLLSKVNHTGFFPTRINGEGVREPHLYDEHDPVINNEKPQDRAMIQEDGPESIGSRVRSSHRRRRRPTISNETSHARFLNQEDESLLIEPGEKQRRRPRRSGRSP